MAKLKYVLYIGDARQILPELEPESIDLVVTSPPYAWELKYSDHKLQMGNILDTRAFFRELAKVWRQCFRLLKPGGFLAVNFADIHDAKKVRGRNVIEPLVGYMVESVRSAGFDLVSTWIWRKYHPAAILSKVPLLSHGSLSTGKYVPKAVKNWEYVFVWWKPTANLKRVFDVRDEEWYPEYVDGVWNIEYKPDERDFGAFPVELPRRLIKIYSVKGDTVLDPFIGSGTTMKAAFELKRSCIGIEIDESRIPRIREKVGWGSQPLDGDEAEWVMMVK